MLIDKINEARKDGEVIESGLGKCRFCKRTANIQYLTDWDESDKNEMATQTCNCGH